MIFGISVLSMEFLGQAIGLVASGVQIFSFQMRRNKQLYLLQSISAVLFCVSFIMLGSVTAGIMNLLSVGRGLLLLWGEKGRKPYWLALLLAAFAGVTAFTYSGWLSILVMIAQFNGTIAMWTNNGKIIRYVQLFAVSPLWLTHNIVTFAIGAILCEAFNIVSVIIAMIRFRNIELK